jgi:type I restriction enzyme S subunit
MSWPLIEFDSIVVDSAFGPRFSGELYDNDGNVATLRTTDLSEDGVISLETMPRSRIDKEKFFNHFLRIGDLIISRSGRIGTTAVFNGYHMPVLPGAFLIRFRLNPEITDPLFYRYFFNSTDGQGKLLSVAKGAAQQNINITNVKTLVVPLPSLDVQKEITEKLRCFDDLIENNRRRIALLEQSAWLLYREWFVRLRFPGHEHVKVVDGVPQGWERRSLGDIATLNYGKALKEENRIPGKFPVYGSSGIVGSHTIALSEGPGIIVGRKGNVGSVFWSPVGFFPIDTVYFIDTKTSNLFLYYALLNMRFISTDVAVPGLES